MKKYQFALIIITFFSLCGCDSILGFPESEFHLAPESRLPIWVKISSKYKREDIDLKITSYNVLFGKDIKLIVYGPPPEHQILLTKYGMERWHPFTEQEFNKQHTGAVYPNYSIITVDGREEVFEQRKLEPILYITDDPKLTSVLKRPPTTR